jgi:hypothetical protein
MRSGRRWKFIPPTWLIAALAMMLTTVLKPQLAIALDIDVWLEQFPIL